MNRYSHLNKWVSGQNKFIISIVMWHIWCLNQCQINFTLFFSSFALQATSRPYFEKPPSRPWGLFLIFWRWHATSSVFKVIVSSLFVNIFRYTHIVLAIESCCHFEMTILSTHSIQSITNILFSDKSCSSVSNVFSRSGSSTNDVTLKSR